ncbi:MAG TPA: DUF6600 domain-containing protein [Steroidobacteraceae bacterium]|jgi:hypothetical protein
MRSVLLSCLLTLAAIQVAGAQQAGPPNASDAPDPSDPPGRVARLGYIDGNVSMAPAGTDEWADAVVNRPLTSGDRLWVDNGGHAELQVGSAAVYLDQDSGFSFVDLDDDQMHMSLTDGAIVVRVRRQRDDEHIQVDTPNTTVSLLRPGEYHIQVAEGGATTVVQTRTGESEVAGPHNTYHIPANEEGVFKGTDELTADVNAIGPRNGFEVWANERESRGEQSESARYVSRDVVGYEDLDSSGDWVSEPEYGYVWQPRYVAAGWAPYRFGRWAWVAPWGWSWIDDSPWGFAPFHYGRWAYARSRWCWVPGPIHARPVYAPALVAWVGSPGVGVSVSIGSGVGWFPLGPREVYVPGYRYSPRYIRNVNVSNTVIVNNTYVTNIYNGRGSPRDYRYGRMRGAVTVVQRDQFIGGRPIGDHFTSVNRNDLRNFHANARPPAIVPDRSSVLASRVAARQPAFRDVHMNQERLPGRVQPTRMSFDAERRAIEANNGQPIGRSQLFRSSPRERGDLGVGRPQLEPAGDKRSGPAAGNRSGPMKAPATQQAGSAPANVGAERSESGVVGLRNRATQTNQGQANQNDRDESHGVQLHDRPDWARSRRDDAVQRGDQRDDANRAEHVRPNRIETSPAAAAGSAVPLRPPVSSSRPETPLRSNDTSPRTERNEVRPANRPAFTQRSYQPPNQSQVRPAERAPTPPVPRAQPQQRLEPRPAAAPPRPQPQRQEQPRIENSHPQNNSPKAEPPRPAGNKFNAREQKQ